LRQQFKRPAFAANIAANASALAAA